MSCTAATTSQETGAADHPALLALCSLARLHHIAADPATLAHQLGWPPSHRRSLDDLLLAARHLGLKARRSSTSPDRLPLSPLPALAVMHPASDASADFKTARDAPHIVLLAQCDGQRVLIQDPSGRLQGGRPVIEPLAVFAAQWTGELILVTSRASLAGELSRFDFSWFIPSLVKYRKLFGEVLLVSLFLQLFALVSPLFFQVVMDKVLVHRGLTTLDVLVTGLVVVVLFESLLTALRTYVFGRGYGADLVRDTDSTAGNADLMQFVSGVAREQIWFRRVGNNLEVSVIGGADTATVENWYLGPQHRVEQFRTPTGQSLMESQVQNLVNAMAAFSLPAAGQTTLPPSYQTALQPVLAANWTA